MKKTYEIEGYYKVNGIKDKFIERKATVDNLEEYRKLLEERHEGYNIMFRYRTL